MRHANANECSRTCVRLLRICLFMSPPPLQFRQVAVCVRYSIIILSRWTPNATQATQQTRNRPFNKQANRTHTHTHRTAQTSIELHACINCSRLPRALERTLHIINCRRRTMLAHSGDDDDDNATAAFIALQFATLPALTTMIRCDMCAHSQCK